MSVVIFSIGSDTSDFKAGSPTVSIASGVATFSAAQDNSKLCAGDCVVYNTNVKMYLYAKTSTSVWSVKTATGGTPSDITNSTVVSIKRTFNTLAAAAIGTPQAGQALYDLIGNANLVTLTLKVRLAFCKDSVETFGSGDISSSWTTSSSYYIEIFAPYNTATECNARQKHTYALKSGSALQVANWYDQGIGIFAAYTVIDGIEMYGVTNGGSFCFKVRANYVEIKNCWLGNTYYGRIIDTDWQNNTGVKIHDNLIYNQTGPADSRFGLINVYTYNSGVDVAFYNNVIFNSVQYVLPIRVSDNSADHKIPYTFKNNIILTYGTDKCLYWVNAPSNNFDPSYLVGTAQALSGYNITSDSIELKGSSGTGSQASKTNSDIKFKNVTSGSEDFRLDTGSCALTTGIGPDSDALVSLLDAIETSRKGTSADVGVFEITLHLSIIQRKNLHQLGTRIGTRQPIMG